MTKKSEAPSFPLGGWPLECNWAAPAEHSATGPQVPGHLSGNAAICPGTCGPVASNETAEAPLS